MGMKDFAKILVSVGASLFMGGIGSVFTAPAIPTWYATLVKPELSPPNWVFAPVWTVLYVLMGLAAYLVWRKGLKVKGVKTALFVFCVQLVLNALWSVAFFGLQSPLIALGVITLLWLAIFETVFLFFSLSRTAAFLLIPYLLWVSFASYLNYSIWALN